MLLDYFIYNWLEVKIVLLDVSLLKELAGNQLSNLHVRRSRYIIVSDLVPVNTRSLDLM